MYFDLLEEADLKQLQEDDQDEGMAKTVIVREIIDSGIIRFQETWEGMVFIKACLIVTFLNHSSYWTIHLYVNVAMLQTPFLLLDML